jgi:putative DNA primase/helicase
LLHGVIGRRCTCGKAKCPNVGKHPLTHHGVDDATQDKARILRLLRENPYANLAVATGKKRHDVRLLGCC